MKAYTRSWWFYYLEQKSRSMLLIPEQKSRVDILRKISIEKSPLQEILAFYFKRMLNGTSPPTPFTKIQGVELEYEPRVNMPQIYYMSDKAPIYNEIYQSLYNFCTKNSEHINWFIWVMVNRIDLFSIPFKDIQSIYDEMGGDGLTHLNEEELLSTQKKTITEYRHTQTKVKQHYGHIFPAVYFVKPEQSTPMYFYKYGSMIDTDLYGQERDNLESALHNIDCCSMIGYRKQGVLHLFICTFNKELTYKMMHRKKFSFRGKYAKLIFNINVLKRIIADMKPLVNINNVKVLKGVVFPNTNNLMQYISSNQSGCILYKNDIIEVKSLIRESCVVSDIILSLDTIEVNMTEDGEVVHIPITGYLGDDLGSVKFKRGEVITLNNTEKYLNVT